ncbi:MAG: 3-methyl-2-oxobutanoate dehydrogenase subunit VorB [Candidatus Omnitrophica bacterium]|nr:3-methyl-2-oxobutanoate dehydrogenase subunit VorB [Candidatus Omnitrophota bacterium]
MDKILMSGNEAIGEGAIRADCTLYAGYPITPQNELTAFMARRMKESGRSFLQAESELAAINMVFGAAAAGARAMTSSSSPGISLKQEGISYLAGCELPAVVVNVMRGGPGLGNIASSQADYFQATRGGGHGDYFTPVLAPWSVEEAAQHTMQAFDLADFYRTPVLVLADAIIGQMMEAVELPEASRFSRPLPKKTWALSGAQGRRPNIIKSFFLEEGGLERHNEHLREKWEKLREKEQQSAYYGPETARILLIAYGSQARIAKEAVDLLTKEGMRIGLFRPVSLCPFPDHALKKHAKEKKMVLVVEQSLGQMVEDVRRVIRDTPVLFFGKTGGGIPSSQDIVSHLKKVLEK